MRVIEEHHNNEMQVTCEKCGSILGYVLKDIVDHSWVDSEEVKDLVECPVCHERFVVRTRKMNRKGIING